MNCYYNYLKKLKIRHIIKIFFKTFEVQIWTSNQMIKQRITILVIL